MATTPRIATYGCGVRHRVVPMVVDHPDEGEQRGRPRMGHPDGGEHLVRVLAGGAVPARQAVAGLPGPGCQLAEVPTGALTDHVALIQQTIEHLQS